MRDFNQPNDFSSLEAVNDLVINEPKQVTTEELKKYKLTAKDLESLLSAEELWQTTTTQTTQEPTTTGEIHALSEKVQAIRDSVVDSKTVLKVIKAAYGGLQPTPTQNLFARISTVNGHFLDGDKAERQLPIWDYLIKEHSALFLTESSIAGAEIIGKRLKLDGGEKAPDPNERGQTVSILFNPTEFEQIGKPLYFNSVKNINLPKIPRWLRAKLYASLRTVFAYKVRHIKTGRIGYFVVWHLKSNLPLRGSDVTTAKIREIQVAHFLIELMLHLLDGEFVILAGDANTEPTAPEMQALWDHGFVVSGPSNDVPTYVGHSGKRRFDWVAVKGLDDLIIGEPILPDLRNAEHIRPFVELVQKAGLNIDTTGEFMEYLLQFSDHLRVLVELSIAGQSKRDNTTLSSRKEK